MPAPNSKPVRVRENRATIVVYFDDGSRLQWSVRKGSPAALNRDVLSDELARFARSIHSKSSVDDPGAVLTLGSPAKKKPVASGRQRPR